MIAVNRPAAALLALAAVAGAGCSADFAPQYRVTDLRILAIRSVVVGTESNPSTTADGDPPDVLRLWALVANPQARPGLTVTWRACVPTGTDALVPCLDPEALRDPASLDGRPGVIALGQGASVDVSLARPDVEAALTELVKRAESDPSVACHLYVELPVVVVAEAGGRLESALKTVRIAPVREAAGTSVAGDYLLNTNPGIARIDTDPADADACTGGAPIVDVCLSACGAGTCQPDPEGGLSQCTPPPGTLAAGSHVVCGLVDANAIQTYPRCDAANAFYAVDETLAWQWYLTDGTIEKTGMVGNATGDHVTLTPPAGPFTLWVVLRDVRGGVSWVQRDFPAP